MKINVTFSNKEISCFAHLARKIANEQETPVMENVELIRKLFSMKMSMDEDGGASMNAEVKPDFIEDICMIMEDLWASIYSFYKGFKALWDAKIPGLQKKWDRIREEKDLEEAKSLADSCLEDDRNADCNDSYIEKGYGYLVCKQFTELSVNNVDEYGRIHSRGYTFSCSRFYSTKVMEAYQKRTLENDLCRAVLNSAWLFYGPNNENVVVGADAIWKFLNSVPVKGEETLGEKTQGLTPEQEEMMRHLSTKEDPLSDSEKGLDSIDWDEIHKTDEEIDAAIEAADHLCE